MTARDMMAGFGLVAAAVAFATAAHAGELRPIEARTLVLGPVTGVAYYTQEGDGLRVVATLGADDATPVRVTATLAPGQSMSLSVPRDAGAPAAEIVFVRRGDRVTVGEDLPLTH